MSVAAKLPALTCAPLVLALSLGLIACRTPSSKLAIDQPKSADDDATKQGEARETLAPLPVETPTDMLPAGIPLLAEAIEPTAILGLLSTLDEYPQFNMLRSELRSQIGVDLLDATQWEQVGLDAHGPMGVGLLDTEAQGFFVYASLTDQPAFERFIGRLADMGGLSDDLSSAEIGPARVYRFGDELSAVLREDVAFMVFVDRPERAARDYAATIATMDPREALSHSAPFSWSRQQIVDADDGLIYVDPNALIEQIQRDMDARDADNDYGVRYALDELERARKAGEPNERIRELEQQVEEERRWQQERMAAQVAERELVRTLFGPIGAAVFAAELNSDGIRAHGRVLIPGAGALRDVFEPVEAESPLLTALDEPPLMAFDGRANMQALMQLIELFAKADGESLQEINTKARAELGFDVLGELVPTLTGAAGIVMTQAKPPDLKRLAQIKNSLGLAAYVELSNPDVMRKLLDAAVASRALGGLLTRAKRGDAWLVNPPEWREVQLSLVGDRLIISTDTKLATRIRDARPGAQAELLADPNHPLRGATPTPSLRIYQRWSWIALVDAHDPWEQDAESMLYDLNTHPTLNPDEAAKVPRSREFKRKFKEFSKVVDELNAYQRKQAVMEFERSLEFATGMGDAGLQVDRLSDGLGLSAQWRMEATSNLFAVPMRWFMMMDGSGMNDWSVYEDIQNRISALQQELSQIRQADLDASLE